jgi:O-antigen/teichoic acid export membrane protein
VFARDVLRLAGGTTIAQLVVLAAAPLLTRLYAPDAFGAAALFLAVTGIIGVVSCLRYDLSIVIPQSDDEGAALLWASIAVASVTSLVTLAVCLLLPDWILSRLGSSEIPAFALLAAAACLFTGLINAFNYWSSRRRCYGSLATARVVNTSVTGAVQIGVGLVVPAGGSLVVGSLAGTGAAALLLMVCALREAWALLVGNLRLTAIMKGLRDQRHFPMYNTWAALMNAISWQLPALLLGAFFTPTVVGFYALGFRVLGLPMSLVGGAIGQVFYQRAAVIGESRGLTLLVRSVFAALVDFGLVPFVILTIAGGELFQVVFGGDWTEAGVYVQILAPWAFVWFISSPMSTLYAVLDRQQEGLWINGAILVSRLLSLAVGGWLGEPRVSLLLFAVTGVAIYGYLNEYIMTRSGVRWQEALTILARGFVRGFLPCGAVLLVVITAGSPVHVVLISFAAILGNSLWMGYRWKRALTEDTSAMKA